MKRIVIALLIGIFGFGLGCGTIWAQASAQITGAVRDQSGAVLPGVEVSATQTDTGIKRMVVTDETGSYAFGVQGRGVQRNEQLPAGQSGNEPEFESIRSDHHVAGSTNSAVRSEICVLNG